MLLKSWKSVILSGNSSNKIQSKVQLLTLVSNSILLFTLATRQHNSVRRSKTRSRGLLFAMAGYMISKKRSERMQHIKERNSKEHADRDREIILATNAVTLNANVVIAVNSSKRWLTSSELFEPRNKHKEECFIGPDIERWHVSLSLSLYFPLSLSLSLSLSVAKTFALLLIANIFLFSLYVSSCACRLLMKVSSMLGMRRQTESRINPIVNGKGTSGSSSKTVHWSAWLAPH